MHPPSQFTYTYTANSNLTATLTGPAHTVTNTWEADRDVLASKENEVGTTNVSSYAYGVNQIGQRTNVAKSGTAFAGSRDIAWGYDALGQVTKADSTVPGLDRAYQYDLIGNRLKSADSLTLPGTNNYTPNALNQYAAIDALAPSYDEDGNMTGGPLPASLSAKDPLGRTTAHTRGNDRMPLTTTATYDSRNRPVVQTDSEGSVSTTAYDRLGRVLSVKDALDNTTTYTYDLVGNMLTSKAADNLVTSTRTYDALDRLASDKDGKNQTVSYQYDALGRRTSYTDAKGATFSFQFDAMGRLTRRTEPDATFQTYTYDAGSRLLVHTKADGKEKTHHYETAGRDFLTKITYSDGEAPRLMGYDALGRLLDAANAHSTVTRTYDAAGRQLSETQAMTSGPTGTFQYQYDSDGNLARHTRPDGSFIDYTWNARNLLASVISDAPPPVATYTYNARNQIAATVVESGLFTAVRSYDAAGRLTGVTNGALDSTGYTLSADGRRTAIDRNGTSETYGYDNARQVTAATYPDLSTTQGWNYDAAGNRSSATTNGVSTTYLANLVNEYTSITGSPLPPVYDDNGNALSYPVKPQGSAVTVSCAMTWDINNQLLTASNGNGDTADYQYDALGRRTRRVETVSGVTTTTWFFANGWNVELEHDGSAFTRRLTWGLDLSASLQGAGGVGGLVMLEELPPGGAAPVPHFPTYDGNGNITAWVDAAGTVVSRQRYDAYGNIIAQTGTAPSNYGFSTKPMDQVTGLLYYGYRYYDPVTGRWPSKDPIEEDGGINLYGFAGNDGVNGWDHLGMLVGNDGGCRAACFSDKANCYRRATRDFGIATASCTAGGLLLSLLVTPVGAAAATGVCIAGASAIYAVSLSDCDDDLDSCISRCPCLLA